MLTSQSACQFFRGVRILDEGKQDVQHHEDEQRDEGVDVDLRHDAIHVRADARAQVRALEAAEGVVDDVPVQQGEERGRGHGQRREPALLEAPPERPLTMRDER